MTKPATTHPKSIKTFEIHYGIRKTSQSGKLWQNLAEKIIIEYLPHPFHGFHSRFQGGRISAVEWFNVAIRSSCVCWGTRPYSVHCTLRKVASKKGQEPLHCIVLSRHPIHFKNLRNGRANVMWILLKHELFNSRMSWKLQVIHHFAIFVLWISVGSTWIHKAITPTALVYWFYWLLCTPTSGMIYSGPHPGTVPGSTKSQHEHQEGRLLQCGQTARPQRRWRC